MNALPQPKSPLLFFILVFVLTLPFLVLQEMSNNTQILRGIPLSGLAFVCPAIAAVILEYRQRKGAGVKALLKRSFDFRRIKEKAWYLPTLLLYPVIVLLSFIILRLTGTDIPEVQITLFTTLSLSIGFFVGALGEELGWSGYVTEPLQDRFGALQASLLVGAVGAVWHWIPLLQVDRSLSWIAWWTLYTIAARVIMVWLFNNMGQSVFAMALFHMTLNLAWQLFPVNGSHFDIRLVALLTATVALIVVTIWGASTLTKYRFSPS